LRARLRERIPDPNVWRIYATTWALGLAYGVVVSLLALFLDDRGLDKSAIGSLAAWFALGIILFSLPVGALVRRLSAKRMLTLSLLGYAGAVAAFPFVDTFAGLAALRCLDGAFSAGVWVSSETILLSRSDPRQKAFATSLYAIALAFGYMVGPLAARLLVALGPLDLAFLSAGAVALVASGYVYLRLEPDPTSDAGSAPEAPEAPDASGYAAVLLRIKTSCFATFAYGYFQASVVLFLPLFLIESKNVTKEQTILIPAFFAAGMLLFSNVVARFGDKFGHLLMMRVLGTVGATMVLGFALLDSFAAMCVAVFVAGASLASISPVSLALQGVVVERRDLSRATAIYNAFYAAGMLLGPPISSRIFQALGGAHMLYHLAGLWLAFIVFTAVFQRDDPASLRRRERAAALRTH
jgi:MFS family permease